MLEVLCSWIDPSPSPEQGQRLAPLWAVPYLPCPVSPFHSHRPAEAQPHTMKTSQHTTKETLKIEK